MKILMAEAVGTFGLVLFGTGAVVVDGMSNGALGAAGIALVFGLIVFAMVRSFASISGAHINPAVTIALAARGSTPWRSVLPHIGAQLAGALLASLTVKACFPDNEDLGATIPSGDPMVSCALELGLTFVLMLVVLVCTKRSITFSAVVIGATVGLEAFFGGPISGASMNPARSIAPQVVAGDLQFLWLYSLAPIAGALLAVMAWRALGRG